MNMFRLMMIAGLALMFSACSDSNSSNSTADIPDVIDDIEENTEVLLTELVDDIFMASENSEPVQIQDLDIVDNADEFSFTYLTGGE